MTLVLRRLGAAVALTLTLAIGGCAATPPSNEPWRSAVSQAAEQASSGDYPGALATITTLERDVAAAQAEGRISPDEASAILAAASVVRSDLEALSTPEPAPSEPSPPADSTPSDTTPSAPAPTPSASSPAPATPSPPAEDDENEEEPSEDEPGGGKPGENKGEGKKPKGEE